MAATLIPMTQDVPSDTDIDEPAREYTASEAISEQLSESRFFERIVQAAPVGTLIIDDGTIVFSNEPVADLLDYSPEELSGAPLTKIIADEQQKKISSVDDLAGDDGDRQPKLYVRHADGHELALRVTVEEVVVDDERFVAVFVQDTIDRDTYERAINRYEAITQMTGYGIYQLDRDGYFEMVNDTIVEQTGYSRDELLGAHASTLIDEDTISECENTIQDLVDDEDKHVATVELDIETADETIPVEARITLLRSGGRIRGTVGVLRDISEQKEQAEKLRQERGLIEQVLETSPVGIGVITPNGDISRVNDQAEELLGLTIEEITNQTFDVTQRKLYDAEGEQVAPEDLLGRVFDDGERVLNSEFNLERPDGERVWTAVSMAPMLDAAGEVEKAVIIATDITDQKEREETLREERDVIEHILETSPVGIGVITPNGDISRVNDQAEELLGLTIEEITNQTLDVSQRRFYGASGQQVPPEDLLSRVFDDGERVLNSEFNLERPDGERVWTAVSMAPIESRASEIEKAVVIATDISKRKVREKRLRESEARLRQIAENINSAIWMADAELSEVLYINPAYEDITGWSRDSVYDNLMNHIDSVHPQDQRRVETAMEEVTQLSQNEAGALRFQEKYRVVQPNGAIRWVNSFAFPLQDDNGEVYRFVGVIDDITEVKEQQLELGRQRDELETLNQINTVIRRVNQGLVQATTREDIQSQVCETLTDSQLYHAAWIGEVDSGSQTVERKTGDGIGTESLERSFAIDEVGAISTAVESGEIQIIRDSRSLPPGLAVGDARDEGAFGSGQPSAAVIPLVYKETVYDVLLVYSSRANAFSVREQAVLFELGKTIGLAINAVERKQALLTDTITELTFRINDQDVFFVRAANELDTEFELEGITSQADESYLQYFTVNDVSPEQVLDFASQHPAVEHVRLVTEHEDSALFEFVVADPSLATYLAEYGGTITTATFAGQTGTITAAFPKTADVRSIVEVVHSAFAQADLVSKQEREQSVQFGQEFPTALEEVLTERQQAALETAYYAGYFEWPRDSSGEEVADSLDIAPATFHQHSRNGIEKLVKIFIEETMVG